MNKQNQQSIIIGIIIVAVVAVFFAIFLSNQGGTGAPSGVNYDDIPQARLADGGYVLGNPDAPITIIEFADFLCPHCQNYKSTINDVIKELVATGDARLEFRMFNVIPGGDQVFRLTECAANTEGHNFWEVHDEVFRLTSNNVNGDDIGRELAKSLDLVYADLLECASDLNQDTSGQYIVDGRLAQSVGVTGTPSLRIRRGDMEAAIEPLAGGESFDAIKRVVEAANAAG